MLSISDYKHLKLLYDNFFKFNIHIKTLIEKQDWDSVDVAIQEKDGLIRQIIFFEKPRINEIKNNKELYKLRKELIEKEKENIVLLTSLREKISSELNMVNKAKKVLQAYEPSVSGSFSTFEIKDED